VSRRGLLMVAILAAPATARAGTISGTITLQSGGSPVAGAEVRGWLVTAKGLSLAQTVASDGAGNYTLTLGAGTYRVDCRGPASTSNLGDRWYDAAAPTSGGYVAESADDLVVTASSTTTGVSIALEVLGGMDGRILVGGSPLAGAVVRFERNGDPRIHHNDIADPAPHLGEFFFRGLPPAGDYQLFAYDPTGNRDDLKVAGPFTITSNSSGSVGDRTMVAYPADPYEGNNTPSCAAPTVSAALLHASPPQPWLSNNARIGPAGANDVDWFCFLADDYDRLLIEATTAFSFGGATRYHPFTDPILSWWSGQGVTKLAEDDDSGSGDYDAFIDTGPIMAGCYCAAVSTFGDPDYNGTGQQSVGRFTLRFDMGNRPPALYVRKGSTNVPRAPTPLVIAEGQTLDLTLSYPDLDGNPVTPTFSHRDSGATPVTAGTLSLGATAGSYSWTAGATAAQQSPYTITVTAADGEFTSTYDVLLVVTAVNDPPDLPTLIAPIGGAVTASATPTLTIGNATDPDGDPLAYDIELYYGDTATAAAQTTTVAEASPQTTWVPAAIAENTRVYWRARARDSADALSPWTGFEEFLVDSANDPPEAPVLIKPGDGEELMVRRPGLAVINVTDPEGEDVSFVFEIDTDPAFPAPVWTSAPVPMNTVSATTMTAVDADLAWGTEYWARARAEDARGGQSGWSNLRRFRIKQNLPPGSPGLGGGCRTETYSPDPPDAFVFDNPTDPEGEALTLELEIYPFDSPGVGTPVVTASAPVSATAATTEVGFDGSLLADGHYVYRVRASDGDLTSDWVDCDFWVVIPESAAGGCCRSSGPGGEVPLALLVLALAARRRRHRR